jgi:hypothetical protein
MEETLKNQQQSAQPLVSTAGDAYRRLKTLMEFGRQKKSSPVDDIALLRIYSEARLQGLLLRQVWASFVTLRGNLPDIARDIGYCRGRLETVAQRLATACAADASANDQEQTEGHGANEAAERFVAGLTPELAADWERIASATVETRFYSLTNVCLKEPGNLANFEAELLGAAREFVRARMPKTDVAELFLHKLREVDSPEAAIAQLVEKTAPVVASTEDFFPSDMRFVAMPSGPAGDELRELVNRAVPECECLMLPGNDEVVIYREFSNLPLVDLDLLGPIGEAAHTQLNATKGLTAYSRSDVAFHLFQPEDEDLSTVSSESTDSN